MMFVTACSNLRALNYQIATEDTYRSRAIAGKIIPAIATTTVLVTGLLCLKLYKIVGTLRKELAVEDYKNGCINLAVPLHDIVGTHSACQDQDSRQGQGVELDDIG